MKTQQIVLAARPIGTPTNENFRFEDIELPELQNDESTSRRVILFS